VRIEEAVSFIEGAAFSFFSVCRATATGAHTTRQR
jgi:hypothetical protein